MKEKTLWPIAACALSAILISTACQRPATTTAPARSTTPPTASAATTAPAETPRYGGILSLAPVEGIGAFDGVATGRGLGPAGWLIHERYLDADWTKGAAGKGEIEWVPSVAAAPDTCAGMLAESWEMPTVGTIVFKVRQGVHWALNPNSEASNLMNGREVTADDWIAGFNYMTQHPRSPIRSVPQLVGTATMEKSGPWEITLKTPVDPLIGWNWLAMGGISPPEVLKKYGDMLDWRNVVGTGPFMLTDFVADSSATLVRNPIYWGTDPVGPGKGSQLPYLDGIKVLAMTDISTRDAALRTAKVDLYTQVVAESAKGLMGSAPALAHRTYLIAYPLVIAMRIDKADLPYKDKRVRQALMMATDWYGLRDGLFGGEADIFAFPVSREVKRSYVALEDMPERAQALYRHNPDRAKQLLAEAGYPSGFKTKMIVNNAFDLIDMAESYKAMWAKAGVDVEINPRDGAVYSSIAYSRAYEDTMLLIMSAGVAYPTCLNFPYFRSPSAGYVNDPVIDAALKEIQKYVIVDMPQAVHLYREILPYIVEQAYYIPIPTQNAYSLWWPWVKNYYGETPPRLVMYTWIDQALKDEMTGRR